MKDFAVSYRKRILLFIFLQLFFALILFYINSSVSEPYMDEKVHFDQLEHYLEGDYSYWNELLTTPPGLYLFDILPVKILRLLNFKNVLFIVRAVNIFVFGNLNIFLVYKINNILYPGFEKISLQRGILFFLYPTNYFFYFLYYTDPLSLCMILFLFYSTLRERSILSAVFALLCPLVRQTNIVWVIYICFKVFLNKNKKHFLNQDARLSLDTQIMDLSSLVHENLGFILKKFFGHILSVILFIVFIYWNKGIALGHKEFHSVTFHPTQMLYLLVFLFVHLPIPISQYFQHIDISVFQVFRSKTLLTLFPLLNIIFSYVVYKWTIIHPFILSDNRHYIFYIFKNFFRADENFKYYLCPIYAIITIYLYPLVINSKDKILLFLGGIFLTILVLAPTSLVEFRYFTLPLLFFNFEIKPIQKINKDDKKSPFYIRILESLTLNMMIYSIFNLVIFYVFIFRPFPCFESKECRFIW